MPESSASSLSALIKEKALDLGFDLCGIAQSGYLSEREKVLIDWCSKGMNAEMGYLRRDTHNRANPDSLLPGAKSLVVTGLNYYSGIKQTGIGVPVISRYAYGARYQEVIKKKLLSLLSFIKTLEPSAEGLALADTGPILEKGWAVEAGLGWQGKHSIVINKEIGSFFFIGELILNIPLEYDKPFTGDFCGNCRLCIDSCPTLAINEDRTIDARKCIANLTIEDRNPVPADIVLISGRRVYGCDRCQEVCPWNRKVQPNTTHEFELPEEVRTMEVDDWRSLTKRKFNRLFGHTPIARKKYDRFMKNVIAILNAESG